MTVFDYIVDQLLEIVRLAIYRYAKRPAPAREGRRREAARAEAARPVEKRRARRRSSRWSNPLLWAAIIIVGGIVYRRWRQRLNA